MPRRVPPIARIRLARSLPRLLAWPVLVIGTGAMAGATWLLGSFGSGLGGVVFAALGGVLVLVGLIVMAVLFSIRLEVQEAAVRLSWLGGERIYPLIRGPVTRVRLHGSEASKLRPRFGMFGWALGSARLRDEEEIHVVRLARTRAAILVPTERGRLAIGAADEDQLLEALSRAARARQRLEDLAETTRAAEPPAQADAERAATVEAESATVDAEPRAAGEPSGPGLNAEVDRPLLTGIERALLEQRLAEERAATARAESQPAEGVEIGRPEGGGPPTAATPQAQAAEAGRRRIALGRPRPSAAFVLVPLLGAGAAWGVGTATGTYPPPDSDAGRLVALALVLAGPASSIGAIMALAWWPRLVGVIVSGGLAAAVFIGRALLG